MELFGKHKKNVEKIDNLKEETKLPDELLENVGGGGIVKFDDGTYQVYLTVKGNLPLVGERYATLEEAMEAHKNYNKAFVGEPYVMSQAIYDREANKPLIGKSFHWPWK
ncbi:MAG: hypothetical protein K6E68_04975 [Lachnospiraceae bacterium]|nr:hypothetical protein [Lachnospiraceae bacterium]